MASSLGQGQQNPAGRGAKNGSGRAPAFEGHKIRAFHSPDGWEILVGENATANDYLTTRVAAPSDIWLHVRAATSAHGIIRARNRPAAVSPAALQQAAELVAARSEVKHSSLIPVDYTLKKYVRKPRKSAPGAVTYQNEKTIYVTGIHQVTRPACAARVSVLFFLVAPRYRTFKETSLTSRPRMTCFCTRSSSFFKSTSGWSRRRVTTPPRVTRPWRT